MWYLNSEKDSRVIYVLENKAVTIGRSVDALNCNFAVPDDPSLSRKHASLSLYGNDLVLQDLGSKYGTYINHNSDKLEKDVVHKLKCGDTVKFGKMNCVWKVNQINFVTCTSTLKGENLQLLKNNLAKLGATLKSEWDDSCSYLTMPAITLTIKVVLALVHGAYIVNTDFWNKCIDAMVNYKTLPNPNEYIPQIVESTLNKEIVSFVPNKKRKVLFCGKKIVFFSKRQMEMYKTVLLKSSATPLLLSESKMTKSSLCEANVIVIQYNITSTSQESQAHKDQINEIVNYLKVNKKRVVADAEIGLAILYCSTGKYCNPDFNFSTEVIKQVDSGLKSNKILAQESQEPTQRLQENDNVVVNESLLSNNEHNGGHAMGSDFKGKRKLEETNDEHVNKKMLIKNLSTVTENKKRPVEEAFSNSTKKMATEQNNEVDDMFNFVTKNPDDSSISNDTNKKLNLSKVSKRKYANDDNEEDLFNFVESKKPCSKQNVNIMSNKADEISELPERVKENIVDDVNVEQMRGSKLKELMTATTSKVKIGNVKQEEPSDLDEKFSCIDIGSTTIIVRNDLIVKKEPLEVKSSNGNVNVKNFKKFKKIWPVKMQISIV